jgi:hypothetical protein
MALRDVFAELCAYWDDVVARLGEDHQTFSVLMHGLVDNRDDTKIQMSITRLLFEVLPPDHPILRALSIEDDRSPDAALHWQRTIAELARLLGR